MEDTKFWKEQLPEGIRLEEDGVYRWYYEVDLWHNPVIFLTMAKMYIGSTSLFACITCIGFKIWEILKIIKVLGVWYLIGIVGCLFIYVSIFVIGGGKYRSFFELDEEKIVHTGIIKQQSSLLMQLIIRLKAQNKKSGGIGGNKLKHPTYVSSFERVKKINVLKQYDTIKLVGINAYSQVYVSKEQREFVYHFIRSRCQYVKDK